jgi:hypothetical protein
MKATLGVAVSIAQLKCAIEKAAEEHRSSSFYEVSGPISNDFICKE